MQCRGCGALADEAWRWCPDCGGPLPVTVATTRWPGEEYAVDWETVEVRTLPLADTA